MGFRPISNGGGEGKSIFPPKCRKGMRRKKKLKRSRIFLRRPREESLGFQKKGRRNRSAVLFEKEGGPVAAYFPDLKKKEKRRKGRSDQNGEGGVDSLSCVEAQGKNSPKEMAKF